MFCSQLTITISSTHINPHFDSVYVQFSTLWDYIKVQPVLIYLTNTNIVEMAEIGHLASSVASVTEKIHVSIFPFFCVLSYRFYENQWKDLRTKYWK